LTKPPHCRKIRRHESKMQCLGSKMTISTGNDPWSLADPDIGLLRSSDGMIFLSNRVTGYTIAANPDLTPLLNSSGHVTFVGFSDSDFSVLLKMASTISSDFNTQLSVTTAVLAHQDTQVFDFQAPNGNNFLIHVNFRPDQGVSVAQAIPLPH
jgi:hypothetical protein